jgi:hypothetical protein
MKVLTVKGCTAMITNVNISLDLKPRSLLKVTL